MNDDRNDPSLNTNYEPAYRREQEDNEYLRARVQSLLRRVSDLEALVVQITEERDALRTKVDKLEELMKPWPRVE